MHFCNQGTDIREQGKAAKLIGVKYGKIKYFLKLFHKRGGGGAPFYEMIPLRRSVRMSLGICSGMSSKF